MLLLTYLLVVNENRGADQRRGFFSRKILCDMCAVSPLIRIRLLQPLLSV